MTMGTPDHAAEAAIIISSAAPQTVVNTSQAAVNDAAQTTAPDELFVTPNESIASTPPSPSESTFPENTVDTATAFSSSAPKSPNDSRKRPRSETPPLMGRSTTYKEAAPETNHSLTSSPPKRENKRLRSKSPHSTISTTTEITSPNNNTALVLINPPTTTTPIPNPPSFTISTTQHRPTAIKSARQAISSPDTLPSGLHQLVYFVDAARNQSYADSRPPSTTRPGARQGSYVVISKDFGSDGRRWSTLAYDIPNCYSVEQALKTAICEAMGHALENIELTDGLAEEGCHVVIFADNVACVEHLEEGDGSVDTDAEEGNALINVKGSNDVKDYFYGRVGPRGFQQCITRPIDYAIAETARDLIASGSEWELRDKIRRDPRSRVSVEIRWIPRGVIGQQVLADDLARSVNAGEEEGGVLLFKRCLATRGLDDGVELAVAEWRVLRDEDRRRKVDVGRLIQLQELESEHGWLGLTLEESSEMRELERRVGHLVDCGMYEGLKSPDYGMEWLARV